MGSYKVLRKRCFDDEMMDTEHLPEIRRQLHEIAELSEQEDRTEEFIISFLKKCEPTTLIKNVGGHGIICTFESKKPGPCIVFRAELDALPIQKKQYTVYTSTHQGASHTCGHDGHMTILLGLALYLSKKLDDIIGKVILLFQPAEETAVGAKKVMEDERTHALKPTHFFGLHNIPLYPLGSILVKHDVFTSASQGLVIRIHGISSHAGHPDQGISPLPMMIDCVKILQEISDSYSKNHKDTFITIIHMKLGKQAFGTSPGEGVVMATFRSFDQKRMDEMADLAINRLKEIFTLYKGTWDYEWVEIFPSIKNHSPCVDIITDAADALGFDRIELKEPFCWSEDFSYYLQRYPGAFFGIGSGKNHHVLHHPSYDFPDDLLIYGVQMCKQIIHETQKRYQGEIK
jgi:amidohydrolase